MSERISETLRRDSAGRLRDSRGRFVGGAGSGGIGGNDDGIDRGGFLSRMLGLGKEAGGKLTSGIGTALSGFFSGDVISLIVKAIAAGGLAYALAPVLGGAVSSAFLLAAGGGVIAAGVTAAFQDPRVKGATKQLKAMFKEEFADWGQFFVPGVANFMERLVRDIGPQLKPLTENLGRIFRPLTVKLGDGLIGFLQNILPGLSRFAEASAPLWETLAESLPKLGDDMARFLDHLSEAAPAADVFLNDFLEGLGLLIRGLGSLIKWLSYAYVGIREFWAGLVRAGLAAFDKILSAAAIAFSWVPGIGPKLADATRKFGDFRKKVNAELDKIQDETVTVTIRQVFTTVGSAAVNVGRILGGRAHGGITGAASGGNRGGLTWVGEYGPELVQLPAGSRVNSNPDSMRMAGEAAGSSQPLIVQLVLDGQVLAEKLLDPQRAIVRRQYGGSVQRALGFGGA